MGSCGLKNFLFLSVQTISRRTRELLCNGGNSLIGKILSVWETFLQFPTGICVAVGGTSFQLVEFSCIWGSWKNFPAVGGNFSAVEKTAGIIRMSGDLPEVSEMCRDIF